MQVDPEAGTEVRFVQDVGKRSLSQRHAVSQEQGMREIRRHVLDVMRHNHVRRRRPVGGEMIERMNKLFPASQVESGRGLVQQHDRRVVHEGAGQEHPRAFA